MTAIERGREMMVIPMEKLPPIALEFARKLCSEVGMCGEVFLTAFAVYAQCVEGLPCDDDLYTARPQDVEWFNQRRNGAQIATGGHDARI